MDLKDSCGKVECCSRLSGDGPINDLQNAQCASDSNKSLDEKFNKSKVKDKRIGRGVVESGLTHECGVFGAIACGEWPTQVSYF